MDFAASITDGAEHVADDFEGTTDELISAINTYAARQIVAWVNDRQEHGNTEAAKHLINAATGFMGAAVVAGIDLESALREMCLQAEEKLGGTYLDGYEREAAKNARENEAVATARLTQDQAREYLARLFNNVPAFSRAA